MAEECDITGADVDDIEDLGKLPEVSRLVTTKKQGPVSKVKRNNNVNYEIVADSIIPGTQKVYVKTWGCAHNSSDSEYMAGLLNESGYIITDDSATADVWLLNSCTVKNPAEDHFRNVIEDGRNKGKYVVVAGCVSQASPKTPYLRGLSIVGVQQIDRVVEVVEETLKGNSVQLLGPKKVSGKKLGGASLQLPKVRRNELIEIIPINTGCLNHCTYCKTKHARGNLGSYSIQEIVKRAEQAFSEGVKEIWLTSEDTGAYGRDIGETLPKLLYQLVEVIPEDCMLRLGMTNPPYILEHLEDMAQILSHPRVYSFLHVPVQSGSDYVLGEMKREYCIEDFKHVVDFLREKVPGITIATDIICGFPNETIEDFEETVKLVKEYHFPVLFINQFFPRPGTPAAQMERIPGKEVKQRTKKLSNYFQSYTCYDKNVGSIQRVLVTEVSHDKEHFVGHNKFYEQVLVPKKEEYLGKFITVRIVKAGKHYMTGEVLPDGEYDKAKNIVCKMQHVSFELINRNFKFLLSLAIFVGLAIMMHGEYVGSARSRASKSGSGSRMKEWQEVNGVIISPCLAVSLRIESKVKNGTTGVTAVSSRRKDCSPPVTEQETYIE